jgi:phage gp36-like protein
MEDSQPIGMYASFQNLCDEFGSTTIDKWSDIDGMGGRDNRHIQQAMDKADAEIMMAFVGTGNYSAPFAPRGFDVITVRRWAVKLAGCWLCLSRGASIDAAERDAHTKMQQAVRTEMEDAKSDGGRIDAIRRPVIAPSIWGKEHARVSEDGDADYR